MAIDLSSEKDDIFRGIKQRMQTWIVSSAMKPEELVNLAQKMNISTDNVTFWNFLEYSYGINDKTSIQTLIYFLAFENTVVTNTNQYVMKMLKLLTDLEGGDETEKNSLQKLFESDKIDARDLIKG